MVQAPRAQPSLLHVIFEVFLPVHQVLELAWARLFYSLLRPLVGEADVCSFEPLHAFLGKA